MESIATSQIVTFNSLLGKLGKMRKEPYSKKEKADLVSQYSDGRTETTTGLFKDEAQRLISDLMKMAGAEPDESVERQRRYIIAMAHEMQWELPNGKIDMLRLNGWIARFGYLNKTHHTLNQYKALELPMLVTQFKKVYQSFLNGV